MSVTPITSNNSTDHQYVSVDSETSFGRNALEAKIYNERVDAVLANPKLSNESKKT